jgi:hypothetical protein
MRSALQGRPVSAALALLFTTLAPSVLATTFTVTSTDDSGAGSLRQAILDANGNAGADTIAFNIAGGGVHTIAPASALPTITDDVTIDGYTQPGSSANTNGVGLPDNSVHLIELDGTNSPAGILEGVLKLQGSFAFVLQGLVINRAPGTAVEAISVTGGVIVGCFIGMDPTGTTPLANGYGILADSPSGPIRIGGVLPAERNVISGNTNVGIGFGCNSGNGGSSHLIQGNLIGTDATGVVAAGNGAAIGLCFTVSNVTIGGPSASRRNVISGNSGTGIGVASSFADDVTNNVVQGNFIGTDASGAAPLGNGGIGIRINSPDNAVLHNVISANGGAGIEVAGSNASVQGNFIGTDFAGAAPLGNAGAGIHILASGTVVGGTGALEPNVIAFNGTSSFSGHGVWAENGTGSSVRGNSIHDNFGLGIALGTDGVTANDPGDGDAGANNLQNFPLLKSVTHLSPQGGSTEITGALHSMPSTTYDLDFYSNPACSNFPREYLEGQIYLGASQVSTDGNGDATFDVTLPVVTDAGARISATATDPSGNTSEFSQRLPFSVVPASGSPAGGTPVTVSGTDFAAGAAVAIGGQPATNVNVNSSTSISATTPALAAGTANDLVVTNTDGTTGTLVKGFVADFVDVPNVNQFYSFVTQLVSNAITAGIGGGLYGVNDNTLRQQMAVFLLKAKHGLCYTPPACTGVFDDVPCPSTFAPWIEQLAAEGITGGCGGTSYCPQNPVRRDQMAVFLLKAEHGSAYLPPTCAGTFADVACPSTFANWIEQLAAENITGGCGGGNYCPLNPNTRGQMAVFISKTFNLQ